jgi:predicted HAD superfamily phosphohydrolase
VTDEFFGCASPAAHGRAEFVDRVEQVGVVALEKVVRKFVQQREADAAGGLVGNVDDRRPVSERRLVVAVGRAGVSVGETEGRERQQTDRAEFAVIASAVSSLSSSRMSVLILATISAATRTGMVTSRRP